MLGYWASPMTTTALSGCTCCTWHAHAHAWPCSDRPLGAIQIIRDTLGGEVTALNKTVSSLGSPKTQCKKGKICKTYL